MGVHGLTTYLREKKRLLSTTTALSSSSTTAVPIVVDGWSFIYDLYQSSNLPWVYGGEYVEFVRLVKSVVESWIRVGLKVYFVFDGACPDLKFPTVISRLAQSHVQPAQLFFRTSVASRSAGRFLSETRILPPLAYSACIYALESLRTTTEGLELHFADEEGDPYAVELAGRLGGYVVGNDSDFVIFNSEGYRGYIPLDEMVWQTPVVEESEPINEEDGDFQPVKNSKAKRKPAHNAQNLGGLLPPENAGQLTLSFISYSPDTLAKQLKIPTSLLPLLGALVGNDFSKESESNSRKIQALFFERSLSLSQRIEKVAATIHTVIAPGASHRKAKHQVGSVMDLIDRTVNALLSRLVTSMGTGEIEQIVEKIVNATLQYAIPKYGGDVAGHEGLWSSRVCALHDAEACTILPMISHNVMQQAEKTDQADPNLLEAREKYLDAYRGGLFSPKNMDVLNTGSSWARIFLENPDLETVGRSIGQPIREWIYSILDDTVGLPITDAGAENTAADGNESTDMPNGDVDASDDEELIDVVESDDEDIPIPSDYLAPLKGELHRLHSGSEDTSDDEATEPPASIISHRSLVRSPPTVIDYCRRGTRIAAEVVNVKPISEMLDSISLPEYADENAPPLILRSEEERFTILLRILHSDIPDIRHLRAEATLAALAVRWVVKTLHTRWEGTGSKEREKERWSKNEAQAFLSSFIWASSDIVNGDHLKSNPPPPIDDRNIQLTAQILMAMDTIEQLSQTLLLIDRVPSSAHQFSGRAFHALLTGTASFKPSLPADMWPIAEAGLSDAFLQERAKKVKKAKAEKPAATPASKVKTNGSKAGLFALLGDMDA
ncbi:PIN domain-like protein [Pholiota conissans]|uniref:PIN domain-like protein n=1 Tax=Pholiota conissans TaxID=109636 RepID=A0A9P5ZHH4_9AGAR|nr:PIN domain-like protein [Pholiota conissans]